MNTSTGGPRILVVEDDWMVAAQIQEIVNRSGFDVAGPVGDLPSGLALARVEELAAALLDVDLGSGVTAYPIADVLREHDIPYAFVTSLRQDQLLPEHADRPLVAKPFVAAAIEELLAALTSSQRPDG
jgi:DNA-binding response OmpR family regulator